MIIETVLVEPEKFYESFNYFTSSDFTPTPEQWGTSAAGRWVDKVDDLVLKDVGSEPESYTGGGASTFHIWTNPMSIHVPSARLVYEQYKHEDMPEPEDGDEFVRTHHLYDVGMYAEMAVPSTGNLSEPADEWFTVMGHWECGDSMGGWGMFGYVASEPDKMVVLFG